MEHNLGSATVLVFFFFKLFRFFNLKKNLFLAVLGLCCCAGFSLAVGSRDGSSCGAQASHHGGFSLRSMGSGAQAQ